MEVGFSAAVYSWPATGLTTCHVSAVTVCSPQTSSDAAPLTAHVRDSPTSRFTTIQAPTRLPSPQLIWRPTGAATLPLSTS